MTNFEIQECLKNLISGERKLTNEILRLINLAEQRKIYLERGYGSLFDWLTSYFGYSEAAAQRRIQAARLLRVVPEVSAKMATGELNLTTLAKAQSFIRAQEKVSGTPLSVAEKMEVVQSIENKSGAESQKTLLEKFPDVVKTINQETKIRLDANTQRLSINLSDDVGQKLEEVKLLLSHTLPDGKMSEVIEYVATEFLKRKNRFKLQDKVKTAPRSTPTYISTVVEAKQCVSKTPVPLSARKLVIQTANRECEYIDLQTNKKCKSRFQLEVDHIKPRALGGGNDVSNLRCLCRAHNRLMAQKLLGHNILERR